MACYWGTRATFLKRNTVLCGAHYFGPTWNHLLIVRQFQSVRNATGHTGTEVLIPDITTTVNNNDNYASKYIQAAPQNDRITAFGIASEIRGLSIVA